MDAGVLKVIKKSDAFEFTNPGILKLPLEDILKILSDNHYPFYFGCEMFNRYKKNPEEAMRQTLAWCRERFTGGENGTR